MTTHHFHLEAHWPGGRNAVGDIHAGQLQTQVSIPAAMDGPGVGTNPDEMLLGAAATCYFITLAAMLERAGIAVETMSQASDLEVEVDRGQFACRRITHHPRVTLARDNPPEAMAKLEQLLHLADKRCMISNALRGNVELVIEPESGQAQANAPAA
ncbi:MAG TPA: SACOL1771 family peroxiredoxin [Rhodanobacteraceae bacterium]